MENIKDTIREDIDFFTPITPKKCRKCGSIYITDISCEACGFQFGFDPLGEPFSFRSFYYAYDDFYGNCGTFKKLTWKIKGKKYVPYIRYELTIKRRFNQLMHYFFKNVDKDKERRQKFSIEFFQLLSEMKNLNLYDYIKKSADSFFELNNIDIMMIPFYQEILGWIYSSDQIEKESFFKLILSVKLYNSIRVGYLLVLSLITIVLIYTMISFYPYFLG